MSDIYESDIYESLALGGVQRNAQSLGTFIGWLIANQLLDPVFESAHGSAVARVKMQDLTGADFLTTVLHGDLRPGHVRESARQFVEAYLVTGKYLDDYQSCHYDGDNDWVRFDEVSPKITAAWREFAVKNSAKRTSEKKGISAKILSFPGFRKK